MTEEREGTMRQTLVELYGDEEFADTFAPLMDELYDRLLDGEDLMQVAVEQFQRDGFVFVPPESLLKEVEDTYGVNLDGFREEE